MTAESSAPATASAEPGAAAASEPGAAPAAPVADPPAAPAAAVVTPPPARADPPAPGSALHRRRLWAAGWILLAATAAFAAWAGVWYAQAVGSAPVTQAQARDQVLQAARQEIADLNTVQPSRIGAWQARWLADTTGAEHRKVQQTNPAAAAQIKKAGTASRATVTGAAVVSLDDHAGAAQVIATVSVRQTAQSGATDTVTNRYVVRLTRTAAGWKISSLTAG